MVFITHEIKKTKLRGLHLVIAVLRLPVAGAIGLAMA